MNRLVLLAAINLVIVAAVFNLSALLLIIFPLSLAVPASLMIAFAAGWKIASLYRGPIPSALKGGCGAGSAYTVFVFSSVAAPALVAAGMVLSAFIALTVLVGALM